MSLRPREDLDASSFRTDGHNCFLARTKAKRREAIIASQRRHEGADPFHRMDTKAACRRFPAMASISNVAMLVAPGEVIPDVPRVTVHMGNHRCCAAPLVVTETLAPLLTQCCAGHMTVVDAIYIVGSGRVVATKRCWQRANGEPKRLTERQGTAHEPMAF